VSELIEDQPLRFRQHAEMTPFAWLSLKNGLLNIVTLTLYRFWGKTEVRRRVWAATTLNDEAFEYTGRGVELFLGFLFALLLIGLPFLLTVFIAQLFGPGLAILLLLVSYVFLGWLWGVGQFTAFRYMASRTAWRGVRFHLAGSAFAYGWAFLGYGVLSVLTLGWFWPAASRRLAGRLWGGLEFGDRKLKFNLDKARQRSVYDAYLIAWALTVVLYFAFLAAMFAMGLMTQDKVEEPSLGFIVTFYVVFGAFALVYAAIYAVYHAAALESVAHGLSFDGASFRLNISWRDMAALTVTNILLGILSLGFLMPLIQARSARFLINRLTTRGEADLESVRQSADAGPRTGEGLADAFGISPI
jgi:uncharacterized membrane protein YjgN (DUF898 family)